MIETVAFYENETADVLGPDLHHDLPDAQDQETNPVPGRAHTLRQVLRFVLAGGLNTVVDLLILNGLLRFFPTTSTTMLLAYNSLAYSVGAINSFLLNKYWTFGQKRRTTGGELARVTLITLCGIGWSSIILWFASLAFHSLLANATVWANASKLTAIGGTAIISYLGMRLWVFVSKQAKMQARSTPLYADRAALPKERTTIAFERDESATSENGMQAENPHSLSIVLPAYNEDAVIGVTLKHVLNSLRGLVQDFEIIVVDDGSTDRTGEIISAMMEVEPRVMVITHARNQGYGSALADGFAAATKELTFFMDSDGQFDIHDLGRLLLFIDEYDAVIGYRLDRQDTWVRKLNAWGWHILIRNVLGIHARDIDCAFKLLHTRFLHQYPPETRGAMVNTEMLYRLKRAGYIYREVGVCHLPRQGGRATGAKLRVIARAFRELFILARRWRREERTQAQPLYISERHPF